MWGSEMVMLFRNKSPQDPPMNISGSKLSKGVSSWGVARDRHLRELLSCQSRSSPGPGAQGNVSSQTHLATAGHDHISGHQKRATGSVLIRSGGALRACFSLGCWEWECRVCSCPQDTRAQVQCRQFQAQQRKALLHRTHRHMFEHPVSSLMLFTALSRSHYLDFLCKVHVKAKG